MSDTEPIILFRPKGKPEQLTREQLRTMSPEDIERAKVGGHLDQLMGRLPKPEQPSPPASHPFSDLARDIVNKARP